MLGTITARSDAIGRAVGGAILGAFTKPTVRATTNPTVNVRLGGNVTASGAIVAKSDVTSAANAIGSVFSVSLIVAVSSVDVTATDSPTLRTSVPAGSIINGGSISIGALHNFPYPASVTDPTRGAHASADVEGGGTISVGDTDVNAVANASVDTTVAATATLRALALAPDGTIEIVSRSGNIADARIKSRSGGAINVNIINPTATAIGTTTVSMLGSVVSPDGGAGARELSVLSEGESIATSNLDTKAGGAIQVTASSTARASSTPTVRATIGSSGAVIRTLGDLTVKAAGITDADSSAQTATGGFVNVQSFAANASTQPTVAVNVGADARLGSGATITIAAVHNESPPPQSDGTFTAPGAVDTSNGTTGNKITFALPHGLGSGDVVTYDAQLNLAGNTAIGGLTNGRQYAVIVASPTALQFGAVFTSAQVDTTRDTVRFGAYVTDAGRHDDVRRRRPQPARRRLRVLLRPRGRDSVGGLVSGQRYIVNVVDSYTLKLLLPGTVEKAVSLPASQVGLRRGHQRRHDQRGEHVRRGRRGDLPRAAGPLVRQRRGRARGGRQRPAAAQQRQHADLRQRRHDLPRLQPRRQRQLPDRPRLRDGRPDHLHRQRRQPHHGLRDRVRGAADALRHPHRPVPHQAGRQPLPRDGL